MIHCILYSVPVCFQRLNSVKIVKFSMHVSIIFLYLSCYNAKSCLFSVGEFTITRIVMSAKVTTSICVHVSSVRRNETSTILLCVGVTDDRRFILVRLWFLVAEIMGCDDIADR